MSTPAQIRAAARKRGAEPTNQPATAAERVAKYRASGRTITCIIRDPEALAALTALEKEHGGPTAAVTSALKIAVRYPEI